MAHKLTEPTQPSIDDGFKKASLSAEQQQHLADLQADAFVAAGISFNVAGHPRVRRWINALNSAFRMPGPDALAKTADHRYVQLRESLVKELKSVPYMSITTDAATTVAGNELVAVTGHYITDDWKMRSVVIALLPVEESKTGDMLDTIMSGLTEAWGHHTVIGCTTGEQMSWLSSA
jgi:hypothetical protein